MKHPIFIFVFCLAMVTLHAPAETFVISDGETNSIVVATNEAIIIDFVDSYSSYPIYRRGGVSNSVDLMPGSAFAGPSELIVSANSNSKVITFHRLQTVAVTTVVLGASDTNTIVVPTNKTLKIFATRGAGTLIISRGTHSAIIANLDVAMRAGCELTGPLTVTMIGNGSPGDYQRVFSYYFTEDFLEITADGYLKGPSGMFEVLVEKSTNLAQWLPVMVQNTASSDARAFYRLRIQK